MAGLTQDLVLPVAIFAALFHLLGVCTAVYAVLRTRTSQGAIAWGLSLLTFPYLSLPLYWVFGRDKFSGYRLHREPQDLLSKGRGISPAVSQSLGALEKLIEARFTEGNEVRLLIDGQATFAALFRAIDAAKEYILVQFFIVHDDEIGRDLKAHLIERARAGVKVYFLYDEIGSHSLPKRYLKELRAAGISVSPFHANRGNRFQLNFRNHRKIVVVDGERALLGGINVGDEYLGRSRRFGPWRDTFVEIVGPAVHQVQSSFLGDWFWATETNLSLRWKEFLKRDASSVLILPTGPVGRVETCSLCFLQVIEMARERLWITSPYFVPDPEILAALQLAAVRGVDVRILLPSKADHYLVYLASFSYLVDTLPAGIRVFRYQEGFIHEKTVLVDDSFSMVGTANLDHRSFRLNFEITAAISDPIFAKKVEAMLEQDFGKSKEVSMSDLDKKPLLFRVIVQVARLFAPVL